MRKEIIFLLGILLLGLVFAQETNLTNQEFSRQCLASSQDLMEGLENEGFNVFRINDTLVKAQTIYDSQLLIERQNRGGEYDFVIESCEEIRVLYELAFKSRDDRESFLEFYDGNIVEGMNTEKLDILVAQIAKEINDERYEKVEPLIEEAYAEVSRVQEEYTRLNRFYEATTQSFKKLLLNYGYYLLIILAVFLFLYFIYGVRIKKILINRKIRALRFRKESIKRLMEKTQKEYFSKGDLSESDYQLRSKSFAELIRDIDRQVPLLEESLIKSGNHTSLDGKIKKDEQGRSASKSKKKK